MIFSTRLFSENFNYTVSCIAVSGATAIIFLLCLGSVFAGNVQITCPYGPARVYIDGTFLGKTPFYTTDVTQGEHQLSVKTKTTIIWEGNIHVPVFHTLFVKAEKEDPIYQLKRIRRRNRIPLLGTALLSALGGADSGFQGASWFFETINELLNRPISFHKPETTDFVSRRHNLKQYAQQSDLKGYGKMFRVRPDLEISIDDEPSETPGPVIEFINYTDDKINISLDTSEIIEVRLLPLEKRKYKGISGEFHYVLHAPGFNERTGMFKFRRYREISISVRPKNNIEIDDKKEKKSNPTGK